MTIPTRHVGAPYVDGETLSGADLETDIANAYSALSNIDDSNVASAAGISGTKLADNSVANAKMADNTLTTAKMAAGAVVQAYVSSATASAAMTTATTAQDIPNITAATMTPGSTSDIILLDFAGEASIDTLAHYTFGFSVNGTATPSLILSRGFISSSFSSIRYSYAMAAPATTSMVIKPSYRFTTGSDSGSWLSGVARTFRVLIIPAKS